MTDLPTVGVMLMTYDRLETAQRTLSALHRHLQYDGPLHLHIADDGSPDVLTEAESATDQPLTYVQALSDWDAELDPMWDSRSTTNVHRAGYGGSYNAATQAVHSVAEILLPLEDDWELTRDLDLNPLVQALQDPRVNCIRLGYIGYTQRLAGEVIDVDPMGKALLFDPESPERHVFAGHPRLETRDFQRAVGEWPEGIQAGRTEFEVCGRPQARMGICWPLDLGIPASQRAHSLFSHIGADEKGEIDPLADKFRNNPPRK